MLGQRPHVAVVEVQAGRLARRTRRPCVPPGGISPGAEPGHAVHLGRVDAVEVDRVRVLRAVDERDPQPLALARAQRRAGDAPVVGPGRELHARRDLDLLVDRDQLPLAQHPAARQPRSSCPSRSRAGAACGSKPLRCGRPCGRRGSSRGRRRRVAPWPACGAAFASRLPRVRVRDGRRAAPPPRRRAREPMRPAGDGDLVWPRQRLWHAKTLNRNFTARALSMPWHGCAAFSSWSCSRARARRRAPRRSRSG